MNRDRGKHYQLTSWFGFSSANLRLQSLFPKFSKMLHLANLMFTSPFSIGLLICMSRENKHVKDVKNVAFLRNSMVTIRYLPAN